MSDIKKSRLLHKLVLKQWHRIKKMTEFRLFGKNGIITRITEHKNVLSGPIYFGTIALLFLFLTIIYSNNQNIQIAAIILVACIIVFIFGMTWYFSIKNPKLLQSEKHIE